jgi:hypothetical protein
MSPSPFAVYSSRSRGTLEGNSLYGTELDAEGPFFLRTKIAGWQDFGMNDSFPIKHYTDTGFLGKEFTAMMKRAGECAAKAAYALLGIYLDGHLFIFGSHAFFHQRIGISSSASLAATSSKPREERVFFVGHPFSRSQP